jgi:hypothetical protein
VKQLLSQHADATMGTAYPFTKSGSNMDKALAQDMIERNLMGEVFTGRCVHISSSLLACVCHVSVCNLGHRRRNDDAENDANGVCLCWQLKSWTRCLPRKLCTSLDTVC